MEESTDSSALRGSLAMQACHNMPICYAYYHKAPGCKRLFFPHFQWQKRRCLKDVIFLTCLPVTAVTCDVLPTADGAGGALIVGGVLTALVKMVVGAAGMVPVLATVYTKL